MRFHTAFGPLDICPYASTFPGGLRLPLRERKRLVADWVAFGFLRKTEQQEQLRKTPSNHSHIKKHLSPVLVTKRSCKTPLWKPFFPSPDGGLPPKQLGTTPTYVSYKLFGNSSTVTGPYVCPPISIFQVMGAQQSARILWSIWFLLPPWCRWSRLMGTNEPWVEWMSS